MFYYPGLTMVIISLILQIFVGALALLVGHLRSYYASHKDDPCEDFFEDICCCSRRSQKPRQRRPGSSLFGPSHDARHLDDFEHDYNKLVLQNTAELASEAAVDKLV